mgnify:CR=1 FL=1
MTLSQLIEVDGTFGQVRPRASGLFSPIPSLGLCFLLVEGRLPGFLIVPINSMLYELYLRQV